MEAFCVLVVTTYRTVAAIAELKEQLSEEGEDILIFDLGGGAFDVTMLNIKKHKIGEQIPNWEVRTCSCTTTQINDYSEIQPPEDALTDGQVIVFCEPISLTNTYSS